jgi:hypothetical protein
MRTLSHQEEGVERQLICLKAAEEIQRVGPGKGGQSEVLP